MTKPSWAADLVAGPAVIRLAVTGRAGESRRHGHHINDPGTRRPTEHAREGGRGPAARSRRQHAPAPSAALTPAGAAAQALAQARERIMRVLQETPEGALFEQLLPEPPDVAYSILYSVLQRRSGWASTLVASLELARQGNVVLAQAERFQPIHVAPASGMMP